MRTVLFGLDGATFTVLDHLMQKGIMPNLKRFCEEGTRSELLSTPLPITPQAWTTLATGRSMGHHGIHDFIRGEVGPQGMYFRINDSRDIDCETLWHYVSRRGRRVTVLNYYGVTPPEPINGHSMPGFVPGRHLRRSSYPSDLFSRLQQVEEFDVNVLGMDLDIEKKSLQAMDEDQWLEWINHHIKRERAWFGVMEHLMRHEPSDLTAIVFDGVDKIQHLAYAFLDPALLPKDPTPWEKEVQSRCEAYFAQIDEFLGRTVELAGKKWGRVFIASDHGFTGTHEIVYINKWLHDQGLLVWKESAHDENESIIVDRMKNHASLIDWQQTRAYAFMPSCNGIFIQNVAPEEYESFREDLIQRLYQIKGPDGGQVVVEVKRREDWFAGPHMERVPDLTLTLRDHGFISILNAPEVVIPRTRPAGTHHPHGILIGRGPGIVPGARAELQNIIDVTPLLVHSLGLEIPADYEGSFPESFYEPEYLQSDPPRLAEPETEIRCKEAEPATAAVGAASSDDYEMDAEDEQAVLERLKSLGYIE